MTCEPYLVLFKDAVPYTKAVYEMNFKSIRGGHAYFGVFVRDLHDTSDSSSSFKSVGICTNGDVKLSHDKIQLNEIACRELEANDMVKIRIDRKHRNFEMFINDEEYLGVSFPLEFITSNKNMHVEYSGYEFEVLNCDEYDVDDDDDVSSDYTDALEDLSEYYFTDDEDNYDYNNNNEE